MNETYIRFRHPRYAEGAYGVMSDCEVTPLTTAPWLGGVAVKDVLDANEVTLLAPVEPSKIICIGVNYRAHAAASLTSEKVPDAPLLFFKPPSAIIGPGESIVHPKQSERVDYEAELGVVIGRRGRNVPWSDAEQYIFGYTCVNDVTARDIQKKDGQWSRAKGFDTFCPVGPWIVRQLEYRDVLVEGIHNGRVTQSGKTSLMIFDIPHLIEYISAAMTLNPGDLISTGTPAGIAPMKPGDTIVVSVEGIGRLENSMV